MKPSTAWECPPQRCSVGLPVLLPRSQGGKLPLSLRYHARVTGGKIYQIFLCLPGGMHAHELRQDYLHKLLHLINSLGWFSAETYIHLSMHEMFAWIFSRLAELRLRRWVRSPHHCSQQRATCFGCVGKRCTSSSSNGFSL